MKKNTNNIRIPLTALKNGDKGKIFSIGSTQKKKTQGKKEL